MPKIKPVAPAAPMENPPKKGKPTAPKKLVVHQRKNKIVA